MDSKMKTKTTPNFDGQNAVAHISRFRLNPDDSEPKNCASTCLGRSEGDCRGEGDRECGEGADEGLQLVRPCAAVIRRTWGVKILM